MVGWRAKCCAVFRVSKRPRARWWRASRCPFRTDRCFRVSSSRLASSDLPPRRAPCWPCRSRRWCCCKVCRRFSSWKEMSFTLRDWRSERRAAAGPKSNQALRPAIRWWCRACSCSSRACSNRSWAKATHTEGYAVLNKLVEASLRYKILVIMGFIVIGFMGWRAVNSIPIDAFPDVTPVQVNIYTESPGLAAEDVEQLLTFPVESGMAGLPAVTEIRSVSLFGLSYVSVYFEDDVDIYIARRLVMERLQEVSSRLPPDYGKPEMGPNSSGHGQVFWYSVERSDEKLKAGLSDMDLRTLQDWNVRLILRTATGVDDVMAWGGQERQFQVVIDPLRLIKYGLSYKDVMSVIETNNRQVGGQYVNFGL